jgi:hypothetical protein
MWGAGIRFVYSWGKVKAKEKQMSMIQAVKNAQERLIERFNAGNPQEAHVEFERPRGGSLSGEKFTLILNTREYGNCIVDDMNRYMANVDLMKNGKGMVALMYFFGTKVTKTLYFENLKCLKVTYVDEWVPENLKKEETEVETENTPF